MAYLSCGRCGLEIKIQAAFPRIAHRDAGDGFVGGTRRIDEPR